MSFPPTITSGSTRYELRPPASYVATNVAPGGPILEWHAHVDNATRKLYFTHRATKQTVWTLPDAVAAAAVVVAASVTTAAASNANGGAGASPSVNTTNMNADSADVRRRLVEQQLAQKLQARGIVLPSAVSAVLASTPTAARGTTPPPHIDVLSTPTSAHNNDRGAAGNSAAPSSVMTTGNNTASSPVGFASPLVPVVAAAANAPSAGGPGALLQLPVAAAAAASLSAGANPPKNAATWKQKLEAHRRTRSQSSDPGAGSEGGGNGAASGAVSPAPSFTPAAGQSAPMPAVVASPSPSLHSRPTPLAAPPAVGSRQSDPTPSYNAADATRGAIAPSPIVDASAMRGNSPAIGGPPEAWNPYDAHVVSTVNEVLSQGPQQRRAELGLAAERAMFDDQRRRALEAEAELQRERAEHARLERIAIERERLVVRERLRHEEEAAAIAAQRLEMEQRRLQLERRAIQELEDRRLRSARVDVGADRPSASGGGLRRGVAGGAAAETATAADEMGAFSPGSVARHMTRNADASFQAARNFADALALSLVEDSAHADEMGNNGADADDAVNEAAKQLRRASVQYTSQYRYTGTLLGKHKHGQGRYEYDAHKRAGNGSGASSFYEGDWKHDKKSGKGVASLPHVLYEGRWLDDRPHGTGLLQTRSFKASLTMSRGVPHGNALLQQSSGETFAGKLRNGKVHTPGSVTLRDGTRVEWRWGADGGAAHASSFASAEQQTEAGRSYHHAASGGASTTAPGTGDAIVTYPNGDTYAGRLQAYRMHGRGVFTFADTRDEYTGEFRDDEMCGRGVYRFQRDGSIYEGEMQGGLFHGRGAYKTQDTIYDGAWAQGRMHGRGRLIYLSNGDVWEGQFDQDRRVSGKYVASQQFLLSA